MIISPSEPLTRKLHLCILGGLDTDAGADASADSDKEKSTRALGWGHTQLTFCPYVLMYPYRFSDERRSSFTVSRTSLEAESVLLLLALLAAREDDVAAVLRGALGGAHCSQRYVPPALPEPRR